LFIEWLWDCFVGLWPPRNDKWHVFQRSLFAITENTRFISLAFFEFGGYTAIALLRAKCEAFEKRAISPQ